MIDEYVKDNDYVDFKVAVIIVAENLYRTPFYACRFDNCCGASMIMKVQSE